MFFNPLRRSTLPRPFRLSFGAGYATSTRALPRGLPEILEKRPEDVVVTFAKRTAMSRAKKGQLNDVAVDKLLHSLFRVRPSDLLSDRRLELNYRQPSRELVWILRRLMIFAWVRTSEIFGRLVSEFSTLRNLPPPITPLHLSRCSDCGRDSTSSSHLDRQPAMLVRTNGHSQYRAFHSERRSRSRGCCWGGKHVHEVRSPLLEHDKVFGQ